MSLSSGLGYGRRFSVWKAILFLAKLAKLRGASIEGSTALLTAADVMTREVVTVAPETSVPEIAQILHAERISGVPVVAADGSVIGIVSEGDLIGHALAIGEERGSWWLAFCSGTSALAREC